MPPGNNYKRGRAFEYELKKLFESAGFSVMRGSSSKGEVLGMKTDLIASRITDETERTAYLVIVQAKLNRRKAPGEKSSRGMKPQPKRRSKS